MRHLGWIISVFAMAGFPYLAQACDPAEPGVLTAPALNPEDLLKTYDVSQNATIVGGQNGADTARTGGGEKDNKKPEPQKKP